MKRLLTPLAYLFLIIIYLNPAPAISQCANPSTMDTVVTAAFECGSYTWNVSGKTYTASATDTVISDTCTMHILNFTQKGKIVKGFSITACDAYTWDSTGATYSTSGLYTYQTVNDSGCIVESQLNLIIDPALASSADTAACDSLKWYPLGQAIGSETAYSVEFSESGNMVALGYPETNGGEVKVYEFTGSQWIQKGSTLLAQSSTANFGIDVSLSADGSILAVGANQENGDAGQVKVFSWNGSDWQLMGQPINGLDISDFFGEALDLNNDGTILAVGAPRSNLVAPSLGEVRIYHWNGNDWTVMGAYIARYVYVNSPNQNGTSVALSADGMSVIFGSPFSQVILRSGNPGEFSIYKWNGTSWNWNRSAGGVNHLDKMGISSDLNDDATIWAVGSDGVDTSRGEVVGQFFIMGQSSGERFGSSVSLDQAGKTLAAGGDQNSDPGTRYGVARVYRKDGTGTIYQVGQSLFGDTSGQQFGNSVSLNGNGNMLAVGSGFATAGGTQIYYLACDTAEFKCSGVITGSSKTLQPTGLTVYPNPTSDFITCNKYGKVVIQELNGVTLLEKSVIENERLDVSALPEGMYLFSLTTDKSRENIRIEIVR